MKIRNLFYFVVFLLVISGCQVHKTGGFGIYLLAQDFVTSEISTMDIDQLLLENKPLISSEDIIYYDKSRHAILLTEPAYARIQQLFTIPVKVSGIPFVVCVGKERIYSGALWTPASSISYDGVIILQPFETGKKIIYLSLGYPGPEAFTQTDPRADPHILEALALEKKLK